MSELTAASTEKPQNGIPGLKHLRHDLLSGMVVSLVSLPLSSGIAIASGCPPIYGLTSAIIAGLLFPFIGGAYCTIAGPAAGLAPAIVAVMASLGGVGDADRLGEGYPFLLVVIFMVGCCQLILSLLKLARYAAIIPFTVVEGMLASIGLLIMVKQFAPFFGYTGTVHAHEFYEFALLAPQCAMNATVPVAVVSMVTLGSLFLFGSLQKRYRAFAILPPQLLAVVVGVILGQVLGLGSLEEGRFLIKVPSNLFHGFHSPHFAELFARRDLWYAALMGVITLTMIDGVESLATAMAIDRIDPFHRRSQPNRLLLAMAISNIASSLLGGLTIIPGGVKSKANIAAGGRTLWANFTNSICLILYLAVGSSIINLIPRGVLAAVLLYTGWKMCEPFVWHHIAKVGREQLAVFTFTIVVTLATDLLWGIVAGTIAEFLVNAWLCRSALQNTPDSAASSLGQQIRGFFGDPIGRRELVGQQYHIHAVGPLVCFNSMKLTEALEVIPAEASSVRFHVDPSVTVVDHSSCDALLHYAREMEANNIPFTIDGLEGMRPLSDHRAAVRVGGHTPLPQPA